jgi:hypothetical protein
VYSFKNGFKLKNLKFLFISIHKYITVTSKLSQINALYMIDINFISITYNDKFLNLYIKNQDNIK